MERYHYAPPEELGEERDQLWEALQVLNDDPQVQRFAQRGYALGYLLPGQIENPRLIQELYGDSLTAKHELGHAAVARYFNWQVAAISIVRDGNTLGYTKTIPNEQISPLQAMQQYITICLAGMYAEEVCGQSDHSGCGSDIVQARYCATLLSHAAAARGIDAPPQSFLKRGAAQARSIISGLGEQQLDKQGWHLLTQRVLV